MCNSITPYLPSSSNEKWRNIRIEKTYSDGEKKVNNYILNTETGIFYRQHNSCDLRVVGFKLVIAYPIWGVCSIAFHILRIPHDIVKGVVLAFANICNNFNDNGYIDTTVCARLLRTVLLFIKELIFDILWTICEDIVNAIKDPFYALALTLIGIYTMLFPNEGKSLMLVEKHWRHGVPVEQDLTSVESYLDKQMRKGITITPFEYWRRLYTTVNVRYLAWCCQERGNIFDTEHVAILPPEDFSSTFAPGSVCLGIIESEKARELKYYEKTLEIIQKRHRSNYGQKTRSL